MGYRALKSNHTEDRTTASIDHKLFSSEEMNKETQKYNYKDILVIVFTWLIVYKKQQACK